jgi:predicted nucleic acid-binding protein
MLVLVDTNLLLRVIEPRHTHHGQAVAAIRSLRQDGHMLCLVPQIHYEFWVAATRPIAVNGLSMTTQEAEAELEKLGPRLFRYLRDERAIYDAWHDLVCKHHMHGKHVHDARLVAAMQRHRGQTVASKQEQMACHGNCKEESHESSWSSDSQSVDTQVYRHGVRRVFDISRDGKKLCPFNI